MSTGVLQTYLDRYGIELSSQQIHSALEHRRDVRDFSAGGVSITSLSTPPDLSLTPVPICSKRRILPCWPRSV